MTRILVVDDEIDTLEVLRMFLELSGFQPFTTLNSGDAITLAEVENPDCVLLDIMMPKLDGFSLCKMMRSHPQTMNLPIMFVTAYSPMDLEDRRLEAGADMVLMKPFGMDSLTQSIQKLMTVRPGKAANGPALPVEKKPDALPFGGSTMAADEKSLVVRQNATADVYAAAFHRIIPHDRWSADAANKIAHIP